MNIEALTRNVKKMSIQHDRRKAWRNKNKKRYDDWANKRVVCKFCKKKYVQKHKSTHLKGKMCRKKRGLKVSPRKTRKDKKNKK
jgi:hypothetical protein